MGHRPLWSPSPLLTFALRASARAHGVDRFWHDQRWRYLFRERSPFTSLLFTAVFSGLISLLPKTKLSGNCVLITHFQLASTCPHICNYNHFRYDDQRERAGGKPSVLAAIVNGSLEAVNAHAISPAANHDNHSVSATTIFAVVIFIGLTVTGFFLLWRRHSYMNRFLRVAYFNNA